MNFFEKMQALDRRWIYLVVAIAIATPLIIPYNSVTRTTEPSENIYKMIDSYAGRDDRAVLLCFSHNASTMPELFPMEVAILRHAFLRDVKIFTICFMPDAAPLVAYAINTVKEDVGKEVVSGEDYLNIGYKPAALFLPIVLGMGQNIAEAVETDAEGRSLESLPIMRNIRNYDEMNLIIETSGSAMGQSWITYARTKFGANVAAGITAVMAADAYPFIQSGQLVGILTGLKGAAEYEKMVDVFAANDIGFSKKKLDNTNVDITDPSIKKQFRKARIGMNAQSVAHLMIIFFIILGNIGYFIEKRKSGN